MAVQAWRPWSRAEWSHLDTELWALTQVSRVEEAMEYFIHISGTGSHLGLFAEQTDEATRQALGNFPQAFTHIGLINAALTLNQIISKNPPA